MKSARKEQRSGGLQVGVIRSAHQRASVMFHADGALHQHTTALVAAHTEQSIHPHDNYQPGGKLLEVLLDNYELSETITDQIAQATEQWGLVRVRLHTLEAISRYLHDDNLFFSWVHKYAILLYEQNGALAKLPPPVHKRIGQQQQAIQFYASDPAMTNYLMEKLVPIIPATLAPSAANQGAPIELRALLY